MLIFVLVMLAIILIFVYIINICAMQMNEEYTKNTYEKGEKLKSNKEQINMQS